MNLNNLANLGQIIGAVAVVVSLIYVAYQTNRCCVELLLTGKESK